MASAATRASREVIRIGSRAEDREMTSTRWRTTGIVGVAVLWAALSAAAWRTRFPLLGERPLSWMVEDPDSALLFRSALIVSALLFVAFHFHVRRRYTVGASFSVAMLGGMAAQIVTGLVPINGGPGAFRVHTVAALTLGLSLPVLMWRFAAAQPQGRWRTVAFGLLWLEVAACAVGIALSRTSVAPLAEIVPAAAFHLWIAALTVAGPATSGSADGDDEAWLPFATC